MNLDLMLHPLGVVDVFMVLSIIKIDKIMAHLLGVLCLTCLCVVKFLRAHGECLGIRSRRRT